MSTTKLCKVEVRHDYHKNCLLVKPISPTKPKVLKEVENEKPKRTVLGNKETQRFFANDKFKITMLPCQNKKPNPIVISQAEMARLQSKAVVVTEKEKLQMVEDAKAEQLRLEMESEMRKNELKQFEKKGKTERPARLSWLEREARDRANYLLKRAWELKNEEEDEVKRANSVILQVKCQAIRDAQLLEHKLIQMQLKEEDKRVDQMIEDQRVRSMRDEKKIKEEERTKKTNYIKALNEQLEENHARRLLEAEILVEERRKANEAMFVVMLEELEEMRKQEEEKRKTREALNLANEQNRRAQEIEREEERITDLKVLEYMRMKAERELKYEREKEAERKAKELECARQTALQEKAADLQRVQEAMNVERRKEQYEREWRKKEKEELQKKLRMEEECRLGREEQIRDLRRYQALEIARDKREFEKDLQVQMERQEKERLLELKRQYDMEMYREEILKQINQKEKERIEERQEIFQEGIALRAEEAKKKHALKEILEIKFHGLRYNKVPEFYIKDILRRFNLS